ncbi:hypothetical protein CYLTODRAFT_207763 [Cylindrobasidium torrendii FP15055 ss-10]|uniref:Zn(2)-C6 fungal-type domain-containing protein n=1 Tax=Cylindrobasidium torrendii FP15055 ss-10 TaxID=1314674 RepID=A0A0D7AV54_9AGAR|nr:hypothetical protein CYLTODRAFT_207763 [Cylindrobasidium torrendii FP15055 ss-10]
MAARICDPCRKRRIRCDGIQPTCKSCARSRKSISCTWADLELDGERLLRKGAACIPCRSKKRKCDAQQPICGTCSLGKARCHYDFNSQLEPDAEAKHALRLRIRQLQQQLGGLQEFHDAPSSIARGPILREEPQYDFTRARMIFRKHRTQVGICMTSDKVDLLLEGDMSNPGAHIVLRYATQLWGCRFHAENDATAMTIEMDTLQQTLRLLGEHKERMDITTVLQVHSILAVYLFIKGHISKGRERLLYAAEILLKHQNKLANIALMRAREPGGIFVTLRSDEEVGSLCHIIYIDLSQSLLFDLPLLLRLDNLDALLVLPDVYKFLGMESFCLAARTLSASYFIEARDLLHSWEETDCCVDFSKALVNKLVGLVERLELHLSIITARARSDTLSADARHNQLALFIAESMALASLVDIHARFSPVLNGSTQSAVTGAIRIVGITKHLRDNNFVFLDALITKAWSSALRVLKNPAFSTQMSTVDTQGMVELIMGIARRMEAMMPHVRMPTDM